MLFDPEKLPGNAAVGKRLMQEAHERDQAVLTAIKNKLPELKELAEKFSSHWGYEDPVYRFYHGSFKVYDLQDSIESAVAILKSIAPNRELCDSFTRLTEEALQRRFSMEVNSRWDQETRVLVEAFLHAKYFIEMAVRYGQELDTAPQSLPSGWAALLCLYQIR